MESAAVLFKVMVIGCVVFIFSVGLLVTIGSWLERKWFY